MSEAYDVAIIGAGLVGAAIAFDLHHAGLRVVVLEAEQEICAGVSRTNSGMLHTGFDSKPGTLETRCIRRQAERWPLIFDELRIPYEIPGALLLAKTPEEEAKLPAVVAQAKQNGVEVELLSQAQTLARAGGAPALASVWVPGEAMTDPYETVRALLNGIEVRLGWRVSSIDEVGEDLVLSNGFEIVDARYAVNCGGLFADRLLRDGFTVSPRRGEFVVYPKAAADHLKHVLLPVPNEFTKGVLIFPTLYGYVCAGPTAEDSLDKTNWKPTPEGMQLLHQKATAVLPSLARFRPISAWAGLRTVGHPSNYIVRWSQSIPNVLNVAGIRSTGLSACLGISDYVMRLMRERGAINATVKPIEAVPQTETKPWWERHNTYRKINPSRL